VFEDSVNSEGSRVSNVSIWGQQCLKSL